MGHNSHNSLLHNIICSLILVYPFSYPSHYSFHAVTLMLFVSCCSSHAVRLVLSFSLSSSLSFPCCPSHISLCSPSHVVPCTPSCAPSHIPSHAVLCTVPLTFSLHSLSRRPSRISYTPPLILSLAFPLALSLSSFLMLPLTLSLVLSLLCCPPRHPSCCPSHIFQSWIKSNWKAISYRHQSNWKYILAVTHLKIDTAMIEFGL